MIYYISSNVYHQCIIEVIKDTNELVSGNIVNNKINLLDIMKKEITSMGNIEKLIVDLNGIINLDDEVIEALEMFRLMYDKIRVIILAAGHAPGDELLMKIFHMGIYDIITTDDFNIIRGELNKCITTGKTYRDCIEFKDARSDKSGITIKNEIKKTVYKVLIGIAGTQNHIGVTHSCIVLANYLRSKGFRAAICEMAASAKEDEEKESRSDYEAICSSYDEPMSESCFSIRCIDFYSRVTDEELKRALEKSYNFIILDFGSLKNCDRIMFNKCEIKMITAGSKPWETPYMNGIFNTATIEALKEYHYLFNFTESSQENEIRLDMKEFSQKVHFLRYSTDPFEFCDFPDGDKIFSIYMKEGTETIRKKGFGFLPKAKERKKRKENIDGIEVKGSLG